MDIYRTFDLNNNLIKEKFNDLIIDYFYENNQLLKIIKTNKFYIKINKFYYENNLLIKDNDTNYHYNNKNQLVKESFIDKEIEHYYNDINLIYKSIETNYKSQLEIIYNYFYDKNNCLYLIESNTKKVFLEYDEKNNIKIKKIIINLNNKEIINNINYYHNEYIYDINNDLNKYINKF